MAALPIALKLDNTPLAEVSAMAPAVEHMFGDSDTAFPLHWNVAPPPSGSGTAGAALMAASTPLALVSVSFAAFRARISPSIGAYPKVAIDAVEPLYFAWIACKSVYSWSPGCST